MRRGLRPVLPTVLASSALLLSIPAQAAFPGANGKIAFVSSRNGIDEIYTMESDGSVVTRLTNNFVPDGWPRWSADGSKIVFQRDEGGEADIFSMTATGATQTNLTNHPAGDEHPGWSPDGTQIVFDSDRDGTGSDIFVMQADGSGVTQLTFETSLNAYAPTWSPDGAKIAFVKQGSGTDEIFVMDANGSNQRRLTRNQESDQSPNWTPDGRRLAFSRCDDGGFCQLIAINVRSRAERPLTGGPFELNPAWSPDGAKVTFLGPGFEIFTMNLDGSDLTNVTNNPAIDVQPDWQPLQS